MMPRASGCAGQLLAEENSVRDGLRSFGMRESDRPVARVLASEKPGRSERTVSIAYSGVTKLFDAAGSPVAALAEIATDIEKGEFVSILGPSGCGKSTLLRITAGLIRPSTGTVMLNGQNVESTRTDIGIVFQDPVLLHWKKALKNILFQIEMRGLNSSDYLPRAMELVDLVGLRGFENRFPSELSGGMQHRVALCRALIHDPPVLLMDEPFAALDAMTREQMNGELLKIWKHTSKTIVLVTHSIAEAVFLSTRVLVMSPRPGSIVQDLSIRFSGERTDAIRDTTEFLEYARSIRSIIGKHK